MTTAVDSVVMLAKMFTLSYLLDHLTRRHARWCWTGGLIFLVDNKQQLRIDRPVPVSTRLVLSFRPLFVVAI